MQKQHLLPIPAKPRKKPAKRMTVINMGCSGSATHPEYSEWECNHCGHTLERCWRANTLTRTFIRKGIECPKCNNHPPPASNVPWRKN